MKKLLLLGFAALLFAACGKDDDNTTTQEEQIRQKLMQYEWVQYKECYVQEYTYIDRRDITWSPLSSDRAWTFNQDTYSFVYEDGGQKNQSYTIKKDTLWGKMITRKVEFAGDSCILTSPIIVNSNHTGYFRDVLYPKKLRR